MEIYDKVLIAGTAAVLCGLLLLFFLRRPAFAPAALAMAGLLIPAKVDAVLGRRLNAALLLAAVFTCVWILDSARRPAASGAAAAGVRRPLGLLLLVCAVSFGVGQVPLFDRSQAPLYVQLGGLSIVLLSGGAYFMAAHWLRDERMLRFTVWAFLAAAGIRIVLLYVPGAVVGRAAGLGVLPSSPLGSMFWTWVMALACGQLLANRDIGRCGRTALIALLLLAVYITLSPWRDWASGWLPGLVAMLVILALRARRAVPVLICIFALVALLGLDRVMAAVWTPDQQYSYSSRLAAAGVLLRLVAENPVLGFGPANYYHYAALYPISGWYVNFSSHNTYLDLLLQFGGLGLLCYLWLLVSHARLALRLRGRVASGFGAGYVQGVAGGLAGTVCAGALGDWVLPFAYNVGVAGFQTSVLAWIFLGGLAAQDDAPREAR